MGDIDTQKNNMLTLAWAYYVEGMNWEEAAAKAGVGTTTVYRWKKTPEFAEVVKDVVEELEAEAIPTALNTLIKQARQDNVQAASKLLDVYKGILSRHGGVDGKALTVQLLFGGNGIEPADTD